MPTWLNAICWCSCGAKWGDSARVQRFRQLGNDVGAELERVVLANKVPEMLRHWRLGHGLMGRGREWMPVIATAAQEIALKERTGGDRFADNRQERRP